MKAYTNTDTNAAVLTTTAGSFNTLLKHYLLPLGWTIVDETGFVLKLQNSSEHVAKFKDVEHKVYLTGFRSFTDTLGFPNSTQMLVDGEVAVVGSRNTITSWVLFADSETFYFVLNEELLAFGSYEPLFVTDTQTSFVIGNQYYLGNQTLIVQPSQLTTLLFLEGTLGQFPFSRKGGLSIPWNVDSYTLKPGPDYLVSASPVVVHESESVMRGFLPNLFVFNSNFTHNGTIYSQGGYRLYCVTIDDRCYGVRLDD